MANLQLFGTLFKDQSIVGTRYESKMEHLPKTSVVKYMLIRKKSAFQFDEISGLLGLRGARTLRGLRSATRRCHCPGGFPAGGGDLYGFHGHGGTPIAGWFILETLKMDDDCIPISGNLHMCLLLISRE